MSREDQFDVYEMKEIIKQSNIPYNFRKQQRVNERPVYGSFSERDELPCCRIHKHDMDTLLKSMRQGCLALCAGFLLFLILSFYIKCYEISLLLTKYDSRRNITPI